MFLHVARVEHSSDALLMEIDTCPGRATARAHLAARRERLGLQPSPDQWVSYIGREVRGGYGQRSEFEPMEGGRDHNIPVILEVDAGVHLAQKWPGDAPPFPLDDPEPAEMEKEVARDARLLNVSRQPDGSNGHILPVYGRGVRGCSLLRSKIC